MAEAAQELHLAPNTISTLVGKLADQGLLQPGTSARPDGRSVRLEATDKARPGSRSSATCGPNWPAGPWPSWPGPTDGHCKRAIPALVRLAEKMETP